MKRTSMNWLEVCFFKNTRDIVLFWFPAGILFGFVWGTIDTKGALFFVGALTILFVARRIIPIDLCDKCLGRVDRRDKYCKYCGEKF